MSSAWTVTPSCTTSSDGRIELAVLEILAGGLISVGEQIGFWLAYTTSPLGA